MKFISGGEPGVPEFSCDFARKHGILLGGYCLASGKNLVGIDVYSKYKLSKLPAENYNPPFDFRHVLLFNVRYASHVLILHIGTTQDDRGSFLHDLYGPYGFNGNFARNVAFENGKYKLELDLRNSFDENFEKLKTWITNTDVETLCIVGPDSDEAPDGYKACEYFFDEMMKTQHNFMKEYFKVVEVSEEVKELKMPILGKRRKPKPEPNPVPTPEPVKEVNATPPKIGGKIGGKGKKPKPPEKPVPEMKKRKSLNDLFLKKK